MAAMISLWLAERSRTACAPALNTRTVSSPSALSSRTTKAIRSRRLGKNFLSCCSIGRVRSCVRPVLCGGEAAGHNALRGSGPNQKHAFKDALTQTGSPDPGSTLSALRRHVLATSFKLHTPSSFPGLTSLNCSGFDANQSIALRCRRVGAVHSIKSRHSAMSAECPLYPDERRSTDATGMSAWCQSRRDASQQIASLFDDLVGGRQQRTGR